VVSIIARIISVLPVSPLDTRTTLVTGSRMTRPRRRGRRRIEVVVFVWMRKWEVGKQVGEQ
jgi:hypothetical protein